MSPQKLFFSAAAALLLLALFLPQTASRTLPDPPCPPSSCGNLHNITFPFRLKSSPQNCGYPKYVLDCWNNQPSIMFETERYNVQAINYSDYSIRVVDPGLQDQTNRNCTSFPKIVLGSDFFDTGFKFRSTGANVPIVYTTCSTNLSKEYVHTEFCTKARSNGSSYVTIGDRLSIRDVPRSCSFETVAWASVNGLIPGDNSSLSSIHAALGYGVELSWKRAYLCRDCERSGGQCFFDDPLNLEGVSCSHRCYDDTGFDLPLPCSIHYYGVLVILYGLVTIVPFLGIRFLLGIILFVVLVVYQRKRRHLPGDVTIQDFLDIQSKLLPINYSYAEIKKMTNGFKEKLGEGTNGTVYKGKLKSGPLVAIKMMKKTIGTRKEFLNKVATIGSIHHVNVVHLIGFCVEGSNRALVCEFMPNGSLEKWVLSEQGNTTPLSYKQTFQISLGVAHAIAYLHNKGCDNFVNMPHNVLLDENFNPKISYFGLANLDDADNNVVHSFGMLLIKLARKLINMNPNADAMWIYDQIMEGNEVVVTGDGSEEERKAMKKIIVVALWSIQMKYADRPPMNRIVEMLEGDEDLIEMPPRSFIAPHT
ncbi:unnamed protein product [Cuscuta epithymum]|uniref:non-specific serine/threonine protein kinase n=2 Tax=Cuscuta epithymum TaxID=186058 RepID=A0AAV0FMV9_9ASTE|nr:unnamed protein product [Cuscuta epithymum]